MKVKTPKGNPAAAETSAYLRTWQIFALLAAATVLLAWAQSEFVMTPEVYRNILGTQLDTESVDAQIEAMSRFRWWGYLSAPAVLWVRIAVVALLVQMCCLLGAVEIRFGRLFRIAAVASIAGMVATVSRIAWLVREGPSTLDVSTLSVTPGSLAALLMAPPEGTSVMYHLLSQVNLFELMWLLLMIVGLTATRRLGTLGAIFVSSGVWVIIVFVQLAISMFVKQVGV